MSILEHKQLSIPSYYPFKFQCDICKSVFELTDSFDLVHFHDIKEQMAVVIYDTPAGFGDCRHTVHCCSASCLFEAIKLIPFDATISIPCGGFYHGR